ncbi:hypothetical protein GY45DRAFT_135441 [Cubamyces sp. BRFM 1775]|nr:hypothetical protein GY45DRAFT_135441 [Cubamyces sp. BRFM 1775]
MSSISTHPPPPHPLPTIHSIFTPVVAQNIRSSSPFSPFLSPPLPHIVLARERAEERARPYSPAQLNTPSVLVPPTPLTFQVRPPIALHTLTAPPDNRQSRLPLRSHSLSSLSHPRPLSQFSSIPLRSPPTRFCLRPMLGPSHHLPSSSSPSPSPSAPFRRAPSPLSSLRC